MPPCIHEHHLFSQAEQAQTRNYSCILGRGEGYRGDLCQTDAFSQFSAWEMCNLSVGNGLKGRFRARSRHFGFKTVTCLEGWNPLRLAILLNCFPTSR